MQVSDTVPQFVPSWLQLFGMQVPASAAFGDVHAPPPHVLLSALQSRQPAPPEPHASLAVPDSHTPFGLQHPWQLLGLHALEFKLVLQLRANASGATAQRNGSFMKIPSAAVPLTASQRSAFKGSKLGIVRRR